MSAHILVIGGGITGLATAWELARRGDHVEILERGQPGRESSWAGAGILSLLLPWDYGTEVATLAERSLALYPDWITALTRAASTDPEYRRCGMLLLSPNRQDLADAWLAQRGQMSPAVPTTVTAALGSGRDGLWMPEVTQVRNPRLVRAAREALAGLGVVVHTASEVTGFDTSAGRVVAVIAGDRRCQADAYVVTAGAWSRELLGTLAADLPIRPIRGQMLLYQAAPDRLPCIVYQDGRYLVPRRDGHILAGSTLEDVGFDTSTTATARDELHDFMLDLLPDVAVSGPIRHWSGLRPGSPGNCPIIARHPDLANLYVSSGHFRYGVTLAPASAELLADIVHGKTPVLDASHYRWPDPAATLL